MPTGIGSEKNLGRWVMIMQSNRNHNCMHFVLLVRRHSFSGERDGEKGELSNGFTRGVFAYILAHVYQ